MSIIVGLENWCWILIRYPSKYDIINESTNQKEDTNRDQIEMPFFLHILFLPNSYSTTSRFISRPVVFDGILNLTVVGYYKLELGGTMRYSEAFHLPVLPFLLPPCRKKAAPGIPDAAFDVLVGMAVKNHRHDYFLAALACFSAIAACAAARRATGTR